MMEEFCTYELQKKGKMCRAKLRMFFWMRLSACKEGRGLCNNFGDVAGDVKCVAVSCDQMTGYCNPVVIGTVS